MELKDVLTDLRKQYESKTNYQKKLLNELEKTNAEILRIEGGINLAAALEEENKKDNKENKELKIPKKEQ